MTDKKVFSQFTADVKGGNPYAGDVGRGIDYDLFEANTHYLDCDSRVPFLSHPYRAGNRAMMQYVNANPGSYVLDTGSGTGISTLELALWRPHDRIMGIEMSEGMHKTAQFKFGQRYDAEIRAELQKRFAGVDFTPDYTALVRYWDDFRQEAKSHANRVQFVNVDLRKMDWVQDELFNAATGYCVPHWMGAKDGLIAFFKDIRRILKPRGEYVWATAAHWFEDGSYPRAERWFQFHPVINRYLDEVRSLTKTDFAPHEPPKPQHDMNSIKEITSAAGLETEKAGLFHHDYDLQTLLMNHCPNIARDKLKNVNIPADELERALVEARGRVVQTGAMSDTAHKIQFVPIFRSVKK